jgi:hypothetical protein
LADALTSKHHEKRLEKYEMIVTVTARSREDLAEYLDQVAEDLRDGFDRNQSPTYGGGWRVEDDAANDPEALGQIFRRLS